MEWAFVGCKSLTSIAIPDSVVIIGAHAFDGCSQLTSVIIGTGTKDIKYRAFSNCGSLKSFSVSKSKSSYKSVNGMLLTKDGKNLVCGINGNATITYGVTTIDHYAFEGYEGLTSVAIPDSVTKIGGLAFSNCRNLESVGIPDSVTDIGDRAFFRCDRLARADVFIIVNHILFDYVGKASVVLIPDDVVRICSQAFSASEGLTHVTIPDSVTSIDESAFHMNFEYTGPLFDTTTIPGVKLVDGWAVGHTDSCAGDLDLVGIRGIGGAAFSGCENLTNVVIRNGARSIGKFAFGGCNGLRKVSIPESVGIIDDEAFFYCSGLTSLELSRGLTSIGERAFFGCRALMSVPIPDSVTNIGNYAFYGCSRLARVIFKGNAPNVGEYAFHFKTLDHEAECVVFVGRASTGWGVSVPGIWHELEIEYIDAGGIATSPTAEEVRQEWHSSIASPMEPTVVIVGDEEIWIRDVTNNCYYFRDANARLQKDLLGWTLLLYGATIGGKGIQSNGDLTIELARGSANAIAITKYSEQVGVNADEWSFLSSDDKAVGVNVFGNLLIHGIGSLTINNLCKTSDGGFFVSSDPCGINIGDYGWYSGSLTVGFGTSLKVNTAGYDAIHVDNGGDVSIVGASVELVGGCGIRTKNMLKAKGSMLNILSMSGNCINVHGGVSMDYVFGAFVSKAGYAVASAAGVDIDHSVVCALTSQAACIYGKGCRMGTGFFRLATDGSTAQPAIYAVDGLEIDGAEIEYCTPNGYGVFLGTKDQIAATFLMKSGLLRHRDRIDIRSEFLLNNLWSDFYGLGASYNSLNLEELIHPDVSSKAFIGQTLFDFVKSQGIADPVGNAQCGVGGGEKIHMSMTGGTIVSEGAATSVRIDGGITISGGSLKGPVRGTVVNGNGKDLVCVTNYVSGAGGFQKVTSGWATKLPTGYSTDSLFTDGDGCLYFWLPSSYANSGGGSGSGSGGAPGDEDGGSAGSAGGSGSSSVSGGGSGGGSVDLAFYVPEYQGWTASLIVSSDPFATTPQKTFEQGEPIFLNYAFKNVGNGLAVSNFVNRFSLSNGYYWEDSWVGYSVPEMAGDGLATTSLQCS